MSFALQDRIFFGEPPSGGFRCRDYTCSIMTDDGFRSILTL